jgi:cell division protein FtsZ
LLINITGGTDLTLHEVDKITNEIREQVHPDADVIVGSIFDESLEGSARVSVVATGLDTTPRPTKSVIDLHVSTNAVMSNSSTSQSENIQSIRSENTDSVEASSEPYVYIDETEEARLAEEAEHARLAEEARIAEEERIAEEARIAEEERIAEEARIAKEAEEEKLSQEQSIFDLIDDDTSHDQDNPSLFSEEQKSEDDQDNIHELEITQDQDDDVEVSAEEILDEEILEIPAFLRRQSK